MTNFDIKSCQDQIIGKEIHSSSGLYRFKFNPAHHRSGDLEIEELTARKSHLLKYLIDPTNSKECLIKVDFSTIEELSEEGIITMSPKELLAHLEKL